MDIVIVPPEMINLVWDKVEPQLQRCNDAMPEDAKVDIVKYKQKLLTNNNFRLVIVADGDKCVATSVMKIITTEDDRYMELNAFAGYGVNNWIDDLLEVVKSVAINQSCKRLVIYAYREGIGMMAQDRGFTQGHIQYIHNLGDKA